MNFAICTNFSLDCFKILSSIFKKKNLTNSTLLEEIIQELEELVNSKDFDNEFIFCHLLNKCLQFSQSEYGFIGEIKFDEKRNEKYLHTYSITNIAWNNASSSFFRKYIDDELRFYNLSNIMFGKVIYSKKAFFINKYDMDRNILPSGHPFIKRFMCIPVVIQKETRYLIGLCNKRTNYNNKDRKAIERIMHLLTLIYFGKTNLKE
jgi:hypothetical protein